MLKVVPDSGSLEPVKFDKANLTPDTSIIILDEQSLITWIWHGNQQTLIGRKLALRQAGSLKGHGFEVTEGIRIGREIKKIREIDQRELGKDAEMDKVNEEFQKIYNSEYKELEHFIVVPKTSESKAIATEFQEKKASKLKAEVKEELVQPEEINEIKPRLKSRAIIKEIPEPTIKPSVIAKKQELNKEEISTEVGFTNRLENIEKKLDALINEFRLFRETIEESKNVIPTFVKDLRTLREKIKSKENIDDSIKYPSRDEYMQQKLKEKMQNKD